MSTVHSLQGLRTKPHLNGRLVLAGETRDDGRMVVVFPEVTDNSTASERICFGHRLPEKIAVHPASLKLEGRDDMLEPEVFFRRVLALRDSKESIEPNRSVWKAAIQASWNWSPRVPEWVAQDNELMYLAATGQPPEAAITLRHNPGLPDKFPPCFGPIGRIVFFKNIKHELISEELHAYTACRDAVFCEDSVFRKYSDHAKVAKAIRKSFSTDGFDDLCFWTFRKLVNICMDIAAFDFGNDASLAASHLLFVAKERIASRPNLHTPAELFTEDVIAFLSANLPAEQAREFALDMHPICRKRDRAAFEEDMGEK